MSDWIPFMALAAAIPFAAYAGMAWGARLHKRTIEVEGCADGNESWNTPRGTSCAPVSGIDAPPDMYVRLFQADNGVVLETQADNKHHNIYERKLTVFSAENIGDVGAAVQAALVARRLAGVK